MSNRTNIKSWLAMSLFLLAMWPAAAVAETIFVDADALTGGDGTTWAMAYKYLQDALNRPPVSGDEIWVAEGTYRPDKDESGNVTLGDRLATFQLINYVAVYGGFAGGETSREQRHWQANQTILSGDVNVPGDNTDNSYHVVTATNWIRPQALLDGFTITAGNANGPTFWDEFGGGMFNLDHSSPTVTNCTFSGNSAAANGGGLDSGNYSSPIVVNCTFIGNSADGFGGAMDNGYDSSPTVINCTFIGNSAKYGGGIHDYHGSVTVTNCTFIGNSAGWYTGCGGGMYISSSSPTVTNCTFSGNWATLLGGGIHNDDSSPTVTNCILWGNTATTGSPQIHNEGTSSTTVSYSNVQGGWSGTGNINANPVFVDADGPDNVVSTADDDLRLSPGSPCIDAGDNTAVPPGVTTDLDGNPRFVDDPDTTDTGYPPGVAIVDMGAYEYQPSAPTIPAVSEWGLIIMAVLLVTAGAIVIRRRLRVPA